MTLKNKSSPGSGYRLIISVRLRFLLISGNCRQAGTRDPSLLSKWPFPKGTREQHVTTSAGQEPVEKILTSQDTFRGRQPSGERKGEEEDSVKGPPSLAGGPHDDDTAEGRRPVASGSVGHSTVRRPCGWGGWGGGLAD